LYFDDGAHRALEPRLRRGLQLDRLEAAHLGPGAQGVEVLAGGRKQGARHVFADPALQRVALAGQVELLVREAVGRHRPRIRCGRGGVDQQDAGRALADRFLELIGPAAVVGQRLAAETVRFRGSGLRVVHHRDQQLALHVDALEIVPAFLRRVDAVADEDQRRRQRRLGLRAGVADHDVAADACIDGLAARREAYGAAGQGLLADHLDLLAVAAAGQRLQAHRRGLGLEVAHGEGPAALSGAAAFEQVVGEEGQVGAQRRFEHRGRGGIEHGRRCAVGGEGCEHGRAQHCGQAGGAESRHRRGYGCKKANPMVAAGTKPGKCEKE
jgi:hypothetical protein